MSKTGKDRPSERKVGARVRIKRVHQAEADALFESAGFAPIYVELKIDGNVAYWFGKDQVGPLAETRVLERIPLHWWAHYAIVGDSPTVD